jgi:AraC-like DNA-binding protein
VLLRHAQELLETTDAGVERIARQVGFPCPGNFRTQFHRKVGVTASSYRTTFQAAGLADDGTKRGADPPEVSVVESAWFV